MREDKVRDQRGRSDARWPDCATGWHDRCTQPMRCGCPCHAETEEASQPDNRDDLFAAYVAAYGPVAADDPVLLARMVGPLALLLAGLREALAEALWEACKGEGSHLVWNDKRVSDLYRRRYREYADHLLAGPLAPLLTKLRAVEALADEWYRDGTAPAQAIAIRRALADALTKPPDGPVR